jgi:hypothetical protein
VGGLIVEAHLVVSMTALVSHSKNIRGQRIVWTTRTKHLSITTRMTIIIMCVNVRILEQPLKTAMLHNSHDSHRANKNGANRYNSGDVTEQHRTKNDGNKNQTQTQWKRDEINLPQRNVISTIVDFVIFVI